MPNDHAAPVGRQPVTRDRVIAAALGIADRAGVAGLTMRVLARELGVTPMSLYHHVADKEAVLDGMVDAVFARIVAPVPGTPWRAAMRDRAVSARTVLRDHPWAVALLDSRTSPGPATLRHHDAVLGTLRAAGLTIDLAGHVVALLDAYVYGFAIQEAAIPASGPDETAALAEEMRAALPAGEYPHLAEFVTRHVLRPGYDFADEFLFGLDLILDGLERHAEGSPRTRP